MINIPTNGLLPEHIEKHVWQMCKMAPKTLFTVNVSIDHIGTKDDEIRGVPNAYEKAIETVKRLQLLRQENLSVGIHTVISKFNADDFSEIYTTLSKLVEHSLYITEIAENRNELCTMYLDINPTAEQYKYATDCINSGTGMKGFLRGRYYRNTSQWLRNKKRVIPCYAGHASCQITPNGDVWFCCISAKSVGNIREHDFRDIWRGKKATEVRENTTCSCPLANASYTNMILSPWSLL
jgi:MoaA/NifB/PqqE/SkfB family radical SAM enzyme